MRGGDDYKFIDIGSGSGTQPWFISEAGLPHLPVRR